MSHESRGRILVVDDEVSNIELLAELFEGDFDVLFATDGARALEITATEPVDLILLDVMMPGMDGYAVCERLKAERHTKDIPIVFITARNDDQAETHGLELGALDYVTKPINPTVVRVRVRNQIAHKRAQDQLARLATTDGLTGLANRRRFDEALAQENGRLARDGRELSLIVLDVDHFKAFNDACGHVAGDDCLRSLGRTLAGVVFRPADLVARYGGEEFACILPETGQEGALVIAHRIRDAITARAIPHPNSPVAPYVTVSLGVATARCSPGRSPLHILARADEMLYSAKAAGRNRVCTGVLE